MSKSIVSFFPSVDSQNELGTVADFTESSTLWGKKKQTFLLKIVHVWQENEELGVASGKEEKIACWVQKDFQKNEDVEVSLYNKR